jgi:protein SCO1/2
MRKTLAMLCLTLAACAARAPLHGTVFAQPPPAHEFTLLDQNDRPYALSNSRGQAVALYFGFTHCKDVCPQTLALLGKARAAAGLTPNQLRIVMVTVDPHRDSAQAIQRFFRRVGVQATGLHGSPENLRAVYREYGIGVQPEKNDIGHTDGIFLIDARGRMRELLDPQTPLNAVAADLRAIVD